MSTFAVFGMTAAVALAEARKRTKTTKASGKVGGASLQLTMAEWNEAVEKLAAKIMGGDRVKQLSHFFDAPPVCPRVHRPDTEGWQLPRPAHPSEVRGHRCQGQVGDQLENQDAKDRLDRIPARYFESRLTQDLP